MKASWNLNMCTQMQLSQLCACFLPPFVCSGFASIVIWIKHTSETLALFADWSSLLYSSCSVLNYFSWFLRWFFLFFCFRKVFQHWISSMMLVLQVHFCSLLLQIRVFHCLPRISCSRRVCYLNGADGPLPRFLFQPLLRNRSNRGSHALITECLSSIMVHL